MQEKLEKLKELLLEMENVAIAFSGGVDSSFLLNYAKETLGENVIALTIESAVLPERELNQAKEFVKKINVKHILKKVNVFNIDNFKENSSERCYYCKKSLFNTLLDLCKENNIKYLLDGSNIDDDVDYRPGKKALIELNIKSPLKEAGLTKNEIRELSKKMELPTWDMPSFACLASRIPYGQELSNEKLKLVEKAEQILINLKFKQLRVRVHHNLARIEVAGDEINKFLDSSLIEYINTEFKTLGFKYVTLDLQGYRMGSLNEVL